MDRQNIFPPQFFKRYDEEDDILFYKSPRRLIHVDNIAIKKLSEIFLSILPIKGVYLDLMSGWRSHLPQELKPSRVIGLGLNLSEMAENPQLDEYIIQDLNQNQSLVFRENEFDAVICTVSIQYLTKPVEVFKEVNRVLKPDGVFVVAFSDRFFSAKVIAGWMATSSQQRIQVVGRYFKNSNNWAWIKRNTFTPEHYDPLYVVWASKAK